MSSGQPQYNPEYREPTPAYSLEPYSNVPIYPGQSTVYPAQPPPEQQKTECPNPKQTPPKTQEEILKQPAYSGQFIHTVLVTEPEPTEEAISIFDMSTFTDKAIRSGFVRKVYLILMLQLGFTVGVISLFIFEENVKKFVQVNWQIYVAAYGLFLGIYFALVCCAGLRRKHPTNLIMMAIFTVALAYLVGTISSYHDTEIVLMTLGICTVCCLSISIFSCFTKFDFTSCGGFLFVATWVLLLFGFLTIFTYHKHSLLMQSVYAGLCALLFMLYLAYDTQMIMGGKKYQLSPEEYIWASLQLFMDIINIFLMLLAIFGVGKK